MDWDQIETKWTAMARRIRADVQCGKVDEVVVLQSRSGKSDAAKSLVAKRITAVGAETTQKRNLVSSR